MDDNFLKIWQAFSPLNNDLSDADTFPNKRPLLAHYTSIVTLERILATNEVWFSNPLFMNDLEELQFGILQGNQLFLNNEAIRKACGSAERFNKLAHAYNYFSNLFANEHSLDVYVFCLTEHDSTNTDGLLSMWRGYGGNGNGAALIIDTSKLVSVPLSPLVISPVKYSSTEIRLQWLNCKLDQFAALLSSLNLPDEQLSIAAFAMFDRIKLFALFTKHHGFSEEKEWRIVYLKEKDLNKKLEPMCHYAIGNRGLEPKLKLKVEPTDGITTDDFSFSKIIHQIILGPTVSHPLVRGTVLRMLERIGKPELQNKVLASTIPFRGA